MAFRLLLLVTGLVELLAPKKMVDFWMGVAAKDDDVELRPWVYSVARLEGAIIVLWLLKRRRARGRTE
ncbi:hypothetical protein [Haloarcula amylovorans]|uniref:hypothetical protein n=1 Tax=Haloarcula amylovorans TaxID=2562280 RepID=UPI00107690BC|nr:hypothetical protein [Halomicroarcula amylolytica]